jgi:hypothetical protein
MRKPVGRPRFLWLVLAEFEYNAGRESEIILPIPDAVTSSVKARHQIIRLESTNRDILH